MGTFYLLHFVWITKVVHMQWRGATYALSPPDRLYLIARHRVKDHYIRGKAYINATSRVMRI
jgi:hypothetical protein